LPVLDGVAGHKHVAGLHCKLLPVAERAIPSGLREEVVRAFSAKLGKPAWVEKKPPVGFGWRLHGHWDLMVSEKESAIESIPKSGPHLEVTVCEPQGEPE
jgi:hypothetical protein